MKTLKALCQRFPFHSNTWWSATVLMLLVITGCAPRYALDMAQSGRVARSNPPESTVSFFLDESPMLIKVYLNDVPTPYVFMVDTGGFTMIRQEVADELKLPQGVAMWLYDASGNHQDVNMLTLDSVRVGGMEVRNCGVGVTNFDKNFLPHGLAGLLGSNFLRHFRVIFDYPKNTITLTDSAADEPIPPGAIVVPFEFDSGVLFGPLASCNIEGQIDCKVLIDTGFYGVLAMHVDTVKQTEAYKSGTVIGARGSVATGLFGDMNESNYAFRLREFWLGSEHFAHVLSTTHKSNTYHMILGNKFLKAFDVTIDYLGKRMILIPTDEPIENNLVTYGLVLIEDAGKTVVAGVWEGSAADRAGLSVGDEIIRINGQDTTDIYNSEVQELFLNSNQDVLKLEYIHDGVLRTISLLKAPLMLE